MRINPRVAQLKRNPDGRQQPYLLLRGWQKNPQPKAGGFFMDNDERENDK
ncbi:hypothetical protein C8R31_106143 [Nitrosospira sp. Nsp2]|nr:hypothetical protein C8R31_106143 [Nitrosospira sp. Nsp2]